MTVRKIVYSNACEGRVGRMTILIALCSYNLKIFFLLGRSRRSDAGKRTCLRPAISSAFESTS